MLEKVRIGTAGWSIPRAQAAAFPGSGGHLERYARQLRAVEINSSFHRSHRPSTYARWAMSVPSGFRFSVKLPKEITHVRRLVASEEPLQRFLTEVQSLGDTLGPLLVQLPPSLAFDDAVVEQFSSSLRETFKGGVVCEPRHPSWFADAVDSLLGAYRIGRVAADPAVVPQAGGPGGWRGVSYWRLHGSPRMYYSAYSQASLDAAALDIANALPEADECWCIFDNTASGEASADALSLLGRIAGKLSGRRPGVELE